MVNRTINRRFAWPTRLCLALAGALAAAMLGGCEGDTVVVVDDIPPAVPTGVFTVTGDEVVSIYWNDIDEADLVDYWIYKNDPRIHPANEYHYIGAVAWDENYDEFSLMHWFDDYDVENGETYYYAVLSVDEAGNESNLSYEDVFDTPRPAGTDVLLYDRFGPLATSSGFDFSRVQNPIAVPWDAVGTDIYVEFGGEGVPWAVSAFAGAELQDYGMTHLDWVDWAPRDGYSAAGRVELIDGHSYVVKITDGGIHFAKFQVTGIVYDEIDGSDSSVRIDWAYQIDENNPELRAPAPGTRNGAHQEIVRF